jgi:hypothetical protein
MSVWALAMPRFVPREGRHDHRSNQRANPAGDSHFSGSHLPPPFHFSRETRHWLPSPTGDGSLRVSRRLNLPQIETQGEASLFGLFGRRWLKGFSKDRWPATAIGYTHCCIDCALDRQKIAGEDC